MRYPLRKLKEVECKAINQVKELSDMISLMIIDLLVKIGMRDRNLD